MDSRERKRERKKLRRLRRLQQAGVTDIPKRQSKKISDEQIIDWAVVDIDCGRCWDEVKGKTKLPARMAVQGCYKPHKGWSDEQVARFFKKIVEDARKDWYGGKSNGKK